MDQLIIADGKPISVDEAKYINYSDYLLTKGNGDSYVIAINMGEYCYNYKIVLTVVDKRVCIRDFDITNTCTNCAPKYETLCDFLSDNYVCFARLSHHYISGMCQAIRSWELNVDRTRDAHYIGAYLMHINDL